MPRFLQESDYSPRIKNEIKQVVTGTTADPTDLQLLAESTAIMQIRHTIGLIYDCDQIFTPAQGGGDTRDPWIVKCVITLALFDMYQQTGWTDIPEHRKRSYDTVIQWLRDVGTRKFTAELPELADLPGNYTDIRFNARPPQRGKW